MPTREWPQTDIDQLLSLRRDKGLSWRQIGKRMDRTHDAVRNKYQRLTGIKRAAVKRVPTAIQPRTDVVVRKVPLVGIFPHDWDGRYALVSLPKISCLEVSP